MTIPSGVTQIGKSAFEACGSLTGIWVTDGNSNYSSDKHGVLFNYDKTELVRCPAAISGTYEIPNGVTTLDSFAFEGCKLLTGVSIPDGVVRIGVLPDPAYPAPSSESNDENVDPVPVEVEIRVDETGLYINCPGGSTEK